MTRPVRSSYGFTNLGSDDENAKGALADLDLGARLQTIRITNFTDNTDLSSIHGIPANDNEPGSAYIPLFVALVLERRNLCTIHVPPYLTCDALKNLLLEENASEDLIKLPEFFLEVLSILLQKEVNSFPNSKAEIKHFVASIMEIRKKKILDSMNKFRYSDSIIPIPHMTRSELLKLGYGTTHIASYLESFEV